MSSRRPETDLVVLVETKPLRSVLRPTAPHPPRATHALSGGERFRADDHPHLPESPGERRVWPIITVTETANGSVECWQTLQHTPGSENRRSLQFYPRGSRTGLNLVHGFRMSRLSESPDLRW